MPGLVPPVADERAGLLGYLAQQRHVLRVAAYGLSDEQATQILGQVFAATEDWRQAAASNGIAERELTRMADAFDGLRADVA